MARSFDFLPFICLSLALGACQSTPAPQPASSASAAQGEAFARTSCGGCHAIGLYGSSSNPNAPPFGAIANQQGLTAQTLSEWLRGAHNYPSEMDFYLNPGQVDALTAYMLTLRSPNYRRPSD